MTDKNPFSNNRREGEKKSPIFFHYHDASTWFEDSNILFEGHRGSGKTSILQSFNYENVWLHKTNIEPDFKLKAIYEDPQFIGAIYRCEDHEPPIWERWLTKYPDKDEEIQYLFTTYLNYYFAEQFIVAIKDILHDSNLQTMEEFSFVEDVIRASYREELRPRIMDFSLNEIIDKLNNTHNFIRENIIKKTSWDTLSTRLCIKDNCSFIIQICDLIKKHFNSLSNASFFILIDDINRLTLWQTKCVNMMIACYRYPVSFKISCVYGLCKSRETTDSKRPIANADLKRITLDYEDKTKISEDKYIDKLLELIFNSRLKSVYPTLKYIDLKNVFGKDFDQEIALVNILDRKSESRKSKEFIENYKKSRNKYLSDYWIKANNIKLVDDSETLDKLQKRKNDTALKKYRVTARFSILNEFFPSGTIEYAGLEIIKHLLCGSVRNFLKICEYLWPEIQKQISQNKDLTLISSEKQSKAIRDCAEHVFNGIDNKAIREDIQISYQDICKRFANIFKLFITKESLKKTTECLSFKIPLIKDEPFIEDLINSTIMYEAFVKKDNINNFQIGLHPIISPKFNLPYRSPFYYSETIAVNDFVKIITAKGILELDSIVKSIFEKRINEKTYPLFEQDEVEFNQ